MRRVRTLLAAIDLRYVFLNIMYPGLAVGVCRPFYAPSADIVPDYEAC